MDSFEKIDLTKIGKCILSAFEIGGYSFVVLMMNRTTTKLDLFIVVVLAISIFISFSKKTYLYEITDKIKQLNLEQFSLSLYCNHIVLVLVAEYISKKIAISPITIAIITFIAANIYAFLIWKIIQFFQKRGNLKKYFIKEVG